MVYKSQNVTVRRPLLTSSERNESGSGRPLAVLHIIWEKFQLNSREGGIVTPPLCVPCWEVTPSLYNISWTEDIGR